MAKGNDDLTLVGMFLGLLLGLIVGFVMGIATSDGHWEAKAVTAGVAEWTVDEKGEVVFSFKEASTNEANH